MSRLFLPLCLAVVTGCQCRPPDLDGRRFACSADAECASGWRCVAGECAHDGGSAGGDAAGGGSAGGEAGGAGGGAGGGVSMLPPTQLAFVTPSRTAYPSVCSSVVTLEARDGDGLSANVTADVPVDVASQPVGLSFFSDALCLTAVTQALILAGTSQADLYFTGAAPGLFSVQATTASLTPTSQVASVVAAPTSLVFTTTAPAPLLAGRCFPAIVEARIGATAAPVASDTTVALSVNVTDGSRFFSDSACTQQVAQVAFAAGQSSATFYVKPVTGGMQTVTAVAPFGMATQVFTSLGAVRRGTCQLDAQTNFPDGGLMMNGDTLVNCTVSPAHLDAGSTILVYQATGSQDGANGAEVKCRLQSNLSQVQCRRSTDNGAMTIAWQTFESPTGVAVQRLSATSCPDSGTLLTVPNPVNPASTFVTQALMSSGSSYDDEDTSIARLISSTQLQFEGDVQSSGTCAGYDLQLVELAGAQVVSGGADAGFGIGSTSLSMSVMPAASDNSMLLTQAHTNVAATITPDPKGLCGFFVRGDISSPTTLSFTRGAGTSDGGCAQDVLDSLYYQRVDFGQRAVVQKKIVTLSSGTTTTVPITAVDTTRTLLIAGGQQLSGQSTGETSYNVPSDILGTANALFEFMGNDMVRVTRGRNLGTSVFTLYVVELVP